jgi:hypothetical protein
LKRTAKISELKLGRATTPRGRCLCKAAVYADPS